jgi:hypothetical protein
MGVRDAKQPTAMTGGRALLFLAACHPFEESTCSWATSFQLRDDEPTIAHGDGEEETAGGSCDKCKGGLGLSDLKKLGLSIDEAGRSGVA